MQNLKIYAAVLSFPVLFVFSLVGVLPDPPILCRFLLVYGFHFIFVEIQSVGKAQHGKNA